MNEPSEPAPPARQPTRLRSELGAVAVLVAWTLGATMLLDRTPYGLDEATSRVILLLWSISDQVASPIVTMSVPDVRALFLAPAGMMFSGSLIAAKLCTLFVMLAAVIALFRWRARAGDSEGPLLASGLLLIAPLSVSLIDRVAAGPFLLFCLVLGAWFDDMYRATRVRFGGWYFSQLLLCFALPTLHPAGLAFAGHLVYVWLKRPPAEPAAPGIIPGRERTHVIAGVVFATSCGVLLAGGWPQLAWLRNPVTSLAREFMGVGGMPAGAATAGEIALGLAVLGATLVVLWRLRAAPDRDPLGPMLAGAWAIGLLCADSSFALLSLVLLLHWGFPLLLRLRLGSLGGFAGQRGIAFALLFAVSLLFLVADRARFDALHREPVLSAQDELIRALADQVHAASEAAAAQALPGADSAQQKARSGPRVASQWPGRTMIACRCSTLPLPPPTEDMARFTANLRGVRFVIFDPQDPANRLLSHDFAMMGGEDAQTLSLRPGGVLLQLRTPAVADHPPEPDPDSVPPPVPAK